jgi:biotin carboxylase
MTKRLLIVGTSFHTLPDYLQEHGYDYITLKDVRLAKQPEKKLKRRVVTDFSSREAMFTAADEAAETGAIDGVITTYERYVLPASEIAAHLGIPGLPLEAARACTDKFLMRQKFASAAEPISPDFAVVTNAEEVQGFAESHRFPLILKPANLSKSLLVFKNHDLAELMTNYERMMMTIDAVYAKYAPDATPKVLIEEFMEGTVHSVDAFVDSEGAPHVLEQVVDYQTGYEIGYDDNFHYSRLLPSKLPAEQRAQIRHIADLGCRALGMKNSPAHVEVILTKDGPRIVEIGARNGGYRERMHRLANGIDITGNAIRVAVGEEPNIVATKNDALGVFELFPKTPGIFVGIENGAKLKALPSLAYFTLQAEIGSFVGKSSDGYKMCAIVTLHNADKDQFAKDLAVLNDDVAVQTKAA